MLDAAALKAGDEPQALPDCYVIFITEKDIYGQNEPLYHFQRCRKIGEVWTPVGDGSHIIFANGKYRGNDDLGKLMHDFSCRNPEDMHFKELARPAAYFKRDEKGVREMSDIMEELIRERELRNSMEIADRLFKLGTISIEDVAKCLPLLSFEKLVQIRDEGIGFVS